jgi:REP element-mobilizing transposase RayT
VTLRLRDGIASLRGRGRHRVVERALAGVLERGGFRVVQYSIQTNHLHLLVEAGDAGKLARGVQALTIRMAKGLNAVLERRGPVFRDRYHARVLRTPAETRNALCYVLQNFRRHVTSAQGMVDPEWIDPLSSGPAFDGWSRRVEGAGSAGAAVAVSSAVAAACVSPASAWLLTVGWRRRGLLRVDEVPRAAWG